MHYEQSQRDSHADTNRAGGHLHSLPHRPENTETPGLSGASDQCRGPKGGKAGKEGPVLG